MTCDYQTTTLGIDNAAPYFGWKIGTDTVTDVSQTAYQILVATSPELLNPNTADVWNSKFIPSDQSVQILFKGKPLQSKQHYYWKVRLKTNHGLTPYSAINYFETAFLNERDWNGKWISAPSVWDFKAFVAERAKNKESMDHWDENAPMLRYEFTVKKEIAQARMYICGVGYYEAYLNGAKISNDHLNPAFTKQVVIFFRV